MSVTEHGSSSGSNILEDIGSFWDASLVQRADHKSYLSPAGRLSYTLPDDLDDQERHDHVLEQVLSVEKSSADEDTWFISTDEFDNTRHGKQIGGFLEEYGVDRGDVYADGGHQMFDPEDVVAMYDRDRMYHQVREEMQFDSVSTIIVEEAHYYPKTGWNGTSNALNKKGELDIGKFTFVGGTPHVTYIEVKSNGRNGLTKAKKQLNRFAHYAGALGWEVSCKMALYDDETENIFFFDHIPH